MYPPEWDEPVAGNGAMAKAAGSYATAYSNGAPLPPADDDDGEDHTNYLAENEDAPTMPDPAAIDEVLAPPPPPVVVMPEIPADYQAMNEQRQTTNGELPPGLTEPAITDSPRPVSKLLVVEIRPSGNWKDACRQTLKLADRYEGDSAIRLKLAGQEMTMDFPNHRTDCSIELIEALERLPGISRVYEG
jgi:hypothetical protein